MSFTFFSVSQDTAAVDSALTLKLAESVQSAKTKTSAPDVGQMAGFVKKRTAPEGYRPATLTEIMKICCDVGCEVRDLLAYCDPFGPWNS